MLDVTCFGKKSCNTNYVTPKFSRFYTSCFLKKKRMLPMTAYPSLIEAGKGGSGSLAWMSSAKILPRASVETSSRLRSDFVSEKINKFNLKISQTDQLIQPISEKITFKLDYATFVEDFFRGSYF